MDQKGLRLDQNGPRIEQKGLNNSACGHLADLAGTPPPPLQKESVKWFEGCPLLCLEKFSFQNPIMGNNCSELTMLTFFSFTKSKMHCRMFLLFFCLEVGGAVRTLGLWLYP